MDLVEAHPHAFAPSDWPFAEAVNTAAFTTKPVMHGGDPVLLVSHDEDGDWQFVCGTTNDSADGLIVCLGCAYQRDTSIGEVADLPVGWQAWRSYVGGRWERSRSRADAEED